MPHSADRVHVLERAIAAAIRSARVEGPIWPAILADADTDLTRGQPGHLAQVYLSDRFQGRATLEVIARGHRLPEDVIAPVFRELLDAGYLAADGPRLTLTDAGRGRIDRLRAAWRRWLDTRLGDWDRTDPVERVLLEQALENIATELLELRAREVLPVPAG